MAVPCPRGLTVAALLALAGGARGWPGRRPGAAAGGRRAAAQAQDPSSRGAGRGRATARAWHIRGRRLRAADRAGAAPLPAKPRAHGGRDRRATDAQPPGTGRRAGAEAGGRRRPAPLATSGLARRGGGVKALQRALGVPADGVFGPQTEQALRRYQSRHGLTVDGVAGPQTRRSLGLGSGPVLKRKGNGSSTGNGDGRDHPAGDRGGQPHRHQALPLRWRPRILHRLRLRLLGLGVVRPPRRRPPGPPARLERVHELRQAQAAASTSRSTPSPGTST